MSVPYASASTGTKAREEITKVLRRFGCESIGFMDDFNKHEVLLAFTHRGRQVQLRASAKGWAQMFLREQPWSYSRRSTRQDYEQHALKQGHVAQRDQARRHMIDMMSNAWRGDPAGPETGERYVQPTFDHAEGARRKQEARDAMIKETTEAWRKGK